MLTILQLITLFLVALTMACAVAHALELPGKMRLPKDVYLAVQTIYYPGFTVVGGFAEVGALLMLFVLLFLTPRDSPALALTLSAFIAVVSLQVVFWVVTQPVNRFWLSDQKLGRGGAAFFGTRGSHQISDWTVLRNRWEYSHVARAVMATAALMLLATAIALKPTP
jgi:hypothetical protein